MPPQETAYWFGKITVLLASEEIIFYCFTAVKRVQIKIITKHFLEFENVSVIVTKRI